MPHLKPQELFEELRQGQLRNLYYLCGAEHASKSEALKRVKASLQADAFNIVEFSAQSTPDPAEISAALWALPVLSPKRLVILNNLKLSSEGKKALESYLDDPSPQTVLVLLSLDKNADPKDEVTRAAIKAGAAVCVFAPLKEEEAAAFLKAQAAKAGKRLSDDAARALIAETGTDTLALAQELEKLIMLSPDRPEIGAAEADAGLGASRPYDPFALGRALARRQRADALAALEETLAQGRPEAQAFKAIFQISAATIKQLKAKRMLAKGRSKEEIFQALRLHSYWDRDYLQTLSRVPEKVLVEALISILRTEADLKSKSWLDPALEIKTLLVRILGRRNYQEAAAAGAAG